jgi:hypothetical protein
LSRAVDLTAAFSGPGVEGGERENKSVLGILLSLLSYRLPPSPRPAKPGSQIDGAATSLRELRV